MAEEKLNLKRLLITLSIVFLTALVMGGATYWAISNRANTEKADKKITNVVPRDFNTMVVNGANVNVPSVWGDFEITETPENFSEEVGPDATFKGAVATNRDRAVINVSEFSSMQNVALGADSVARGVSYIEKIYSERRVKPEEFYTNKDILSLIRTPLGAIEVYNPRYIESNNGEWRGVWFVAHASPDVTTDVTIISILYDKESGKVLTFSDTIQTKKSEALWESIDVKVQESLNNNNISDATHYDYSEEISEYHRSAYYTDNEVRDYIDNYLIVILETLS